MGIRFEKDTLMSWVNDIAKFLRLIVEENNPFQEDLLAAFDQAYADFFNKDRTYFLTISHDDLLSYVKDDLEIDQIRPLALVLMQDGLKSTINEEQQILLQKAKLLLNYVMRETSNFAFEDYGYLATIDRKLK